MTTEAKTLPRFEGKPLIPKEVLQANFLQGDYGRAVLEEYQGRVKSDFNNNPNLQVLSYNPNTNLVEGSNPFAVVLVNKILRQEGLRTATQSDLEEILKLQALELRRTYEDTSLVLRSTSGANEYLAQDLARKLGIKTDKDGRLEMPAILYLNRLELDNDPNSPYKLSFRLREDSRVVFDATKILNQSGSFSNEDIDKDSGIPLKLGKGDRSSYAREDGLSGLFLGRFLDLNSGWCGLANSDSGGRVVVVGEANAQKFEEQLKAEYQNIERKLKERFDRALKTLREKE